MKNDFKCTSSFDWFPIVCVILAKHKNFNGVKIYLTSSTIFTFVQLLSYATLCLQAKTLHDAIVYEKNWLKSVFRDVPFLFFFFITISTVVKDCKRK